MNDYGWVGALRLCAFAWAEGWVALRFFYVEHAGPEV